MNPEPVAFRKPSAEGKQPLPVERIGHLPVLEPENRWLIRSLWGRAAVGILAGDPKCCKTWLGLEMAISVASGSPTLGRFPVEDPGPVLVYLAEDGLPQVRERAEGICRARCLELASLPLDVITAPLLRLDEPDDQNRLIATVGRLRPRLLLLDPLVRLHRLNENRASDISWLLGYLRQLQRTFDMAVMLVHHANKKYRDPGRALRGSSDLYAFGDSLAFVARRDHRLVLSVQHRFAPAPEPLSLSLHTAGKPPYSHLRITDGAKEEPSRQRSLSERILEILKATEHPLKRQVLRHHLRVNNQRLGQALQELQDNGAIQRTPKGWAVRPITPKKPPQAPVPGDLFADL